MEMEIVMFAPALARELEQEAIIKEVIEEAREEARKCDVNKVIEDVVAEYGTSMITRELLDLVEDILGFPRDRTEF